MPGMDAASLEGTKAWGLVVVVVVRATASVELALEAVSI